MNSIEESSKLETKVKRAILFGATSEIGLAIIENFCDQGDWAKWLVGTSRPEFTPRDGSFTEIGVDWDHIGPLHFSVNGLKAESKLDLVVISLGYIPETSNQFSTMEIVKSVNANLTWPLVCLDFLQKEGFVDDSTQIVIVSTSLVAVPPTNKSLLYTVCKSTLESLVTLGIKYDYFSRNVIFLRPGFVATKLNKHLPPGRMPSTALEVAETLVKKIRNGKKSGVVFTPPRIGYLALILRLFPTGLQRWLLEKSQRS